MSISNISELELLKKMAGLKNTHSSLAESKEKEVDSDEDKEELEEAWANSTDEFDGEEREIEQPKGEIVDNSLRRYLGAKGDHVTVDETVEHSVENMMESYKKFKGDEKLDEHKDYNSYVTPLKNKGYSIKVSELKDGALKFSVEKDGKKVTVTEPKAGEYKVSGDEKVYSTLESAIKSKINGSEKVKESSSIRELKKNAGILKENTPTISENVIDLTQLRKNAGIL